MNLIIGGAYQGKREFAKAAFSLEEDQFYSARGLKSTFPTPALTAWKNLPWPVSAQASTPLLISRTTKHSGKTPPLFVRIFSAAWCRWKRNCAQWRNVTGQLCQYLSKNAQRVSRVFCGLEQRLK